VIRRSRLAWAAVAAVFVLAACSRAEAARRPIHGMRTVHVTIHYSSFDPSSFTFPAGTTVRFVIRNTDPIEHEFILGPKRVQDYIETHAHPEHDGSVAGQITVPAGQVRETAYTFGEPGKILLGCHVRGHYAYGMRGLVTVTV
jgi:uncharacterized cupredoxin-like copper-binding protein